MSRPKVFSLLRTLLSFLGPGDPLANASVTGSQIHR